jgi:hypothetical protein
VARPGHSPGRGYRTAARAGDGPSAAAGTSAQTTFPLEAWSGYQSQAALTASTRHRPRRPSSSAVAPEGTGGCGLSSWTSISTRARSDASRSCTRPWAPAAWHARIALVTSSETTSSAGSPSAPRSQPASTRRVWCRAPGTAPGSAASSRWLCSGQACPSGVARPPGRLSGRRTVQRRPWYGCWLVIMGLRCSKQVLQSHA